MSPQEQLWDIIVIGAGPAGASAAYAAASAGASVLILEKASLPRHKVCGGGIIGTSLSALPVNYRPPVAEEVRRVTFTLNGRDERTRRVPADAPPLFSLVNRIDFDQGLAVAAVEAGAAVLTGCAVIRVDARMPGAPGEDLVRLTTRDGRQFEARCVIGADGSASRAGAHVGVRCDQVDLGLEAEIRIPSELAHRWAGRIALDWSRIPGSYGWVFPKENVLNVGIIADRNNKNSTRDSYREYIDRLGLSRFHPASVSGHLTRCRKPDSPLHRGRVLVAGDAAGLLEPWTREGISFALRSGRLAGEHSVLIAGAGTPGQVAAGGNRYRCATEKSMGKEMRAGRVLLTLFAKYPQLFHAAVTTAPPAWSGFVDFMRGNDSFNRLAHPRRVARKISAHLSN